MVAIQNIFFIVTYEGLNNELSGVYLVQRYFFLFLKLIVFILLIEMILFEKHVLLELAKILDETLPVFQSLKYCRLAEFIILSTVTISGLFIDTASFL